MSFLLFPLTRGWTWRSSYLKDLLNIAEQSVVIESVQWFYRCHACCFTHSPSALSEHTLMPGKCRMDYLRLGSGYASKHAQNLEQPGTRSLFNSVIRKVFPKRWKHCGGIRLKFKNLTFVVLRWAGEEQILCLSNRSRNFGID